MAVPFSVLNLTNVDDFCSSMEKYLNYLEKATVKNLGDFTDYGKKVNAGYNNYTIYWDWYKELGYGNYQGEPYCAGFVSVHMCSAFGKAVAKKLFCGDLFIYCPTGYNQFKKAGRIYSNPKKGDVVFFWSTSLGRWGHTGYVVAVDENGKGFTTIEANTSSANAVVRNGGATCRKHYTTGQSKMAFGRPPYEENGIALSKDEVDRTTYDIKSYGDGLTITASSLNVRKYPGTKAPIVNSCKEGDLVQPTKKSFENGDPWIYIPSKNGWISAKYVQGWIYENSAGKWWYVYPGYKYLTNAIDEIDGNHYFFGADGYMFVGTMTFETDSNGVLKPISKA